MLIDNDADGQVVGVMRFVTSMRAVNQQVMLVMVAIGLILNIRKKETKSLFEGGSL